MSVGGGVIIETDGLGKTYETADLEVEALSNVSVRVKQGEFITLLGPSGCGKTTLLNILAGLDRPTSGSVTIAGRPPKARRDVGMMFQRPLLFPWRTVLHNVMLPAELFGIARQEARERAAQLMTLVGLAGWEDRYSWQLSGGMQQRVALARVLLPDPDILLLDEPFGSLDEMTRETLDLAMTRISAATGKTIVLVTHSVYEAVLVSDRILVFTSRPGRIAGEVGIPFPRPRDIDVSGTTEFADAVAAARRIMKEESHER